ncbi:SPP1 family predicted phage head-tail adaptor [Mycoplana sp. BE70]|uniref:phage head closure protein n=1 Tax=Mycoplana sp. BE70 TaxID=2817775 RepID=UPI002857EA58|nr:phage head closure protein [Mycoplana sp. BE70]MDR6757213.1 SPP1 family predicted phage head-tail adaptor [Mycoplana sp. BE70]
MKRPVIDPGAFSALLTVEQAVEVADGQGGVIRTHAATAAVWARIEPATADRVLAAGAQAMTVTHRIWLRHRSDLRSGMRLRKGARVFEIRTFRDPDETARYLVCECEETE